MSAKKPHLNIIFVGHVDHGKSTTLGRLFYELGKFSDRDIPEEAGTFKFAWLMDRLKEERERGLTIDLFHEKIETKKYYITVIDAPGHRDFVKNMITGASQADGAILVVSAKKGEGVQAQTREHAYLLWILGVKQLIVTINKMDDSTVNYSKERYEEVKKEVEDLLTKLKFDVKKIPFIPTSGWMGDNLLKKSDKTPWYDGPTLFEALDMFELPPKPTDKPLRIPVQDVFNIRGVGVVPVGRVESGILKPGDKIVFKPIDEVGEVKSIEMHHERLEKAEPGDNIGFNVKGVSIKKLKRGDVAGHLDTPPQVVSEFTGRIAILSHPTAIAEGYTPVLHAHTAHAACKFDKLMQKLDPKTGAVVEENPKYLKTGDIAVVKFVPVQPICLEKYSFIPALGRFAIRDMGKTIAAGVVVDFVPKEK